MKIIFLLSLITLTPLDSFGAENGKKGNWTEVVNLPDDGQYSLNFDPDDSRVDVTKLDPGSALPAEMKLRILREGDSPLDLKLKALDPPADINRYTGEFEPWNGSVMGFELEMSFDKTTWKKVERIFGAP